MTSASPFIAIDDSKLLNSPWYILQASLVHQDQGITLYEHLYDIGPQTTNNHWYLDESSSEQAQDMLGDGLFHWHHQHHNLH